MDGMSIQDLIDNGMAWRLEGSIGRQCMAAIEDGRAMLGPVGHRDYWGNYIPSRHEVQPYTVGSPEYAATMQDMEDAARLREQDWCSHCALPVGDDPDTYHCDDCDEYVHADCMDWATVGNWDVETGNHFDCGA